MGEPVEPVPNEDHAARLLAALRAASFAYLAYAASEVYSGRERQLTSAVLPAAMAAAAWVPTPEGWWFLAAGFFLCAFREGPGHWAPALGLIASAVVLLRCRSLFFPFGRLHHWALDALAVWLAAALFGLPRAERSFYPTHLPPAAFSPSYLREPDLSMPAPPDTPPSAAQIPAPPAPALQKPRAQGAWDPKPELARKLALVHELAPQSILAGDESGKVMALTIKLDDMLKSQARDEARIEAAADQILLIIYPSALSPAAQPKRLRVVKP